MNEIRSKLVTLKLWFSSEVQRISQKDKQAYSAGSQTHDSRLVISKEMKNKLSHLVVTQTSSCLQKNKKQKKKS